MATIGTFTQQADGAYSGSIKTLTLNVKSSQLRANEKTDEKAPDFRIFSGQTEFGAAWKKTSQQNRDYLSVKLDDRVMVYGGYDRGYKSGGYNLDRGSFDTAFLGGNGAQVSDLEFGNEDVDSFEFGVKTDLSAAFQFNANAFYTELKGYQNLAFEGNNFVVQNFDKVVAQGVELESIIRPAPSLNIMLGYSYVDTEVKDVAGCRRVRNIEHGGRPLRDRVGDLPGLGVAHAGAAVAVEQHQVP